jgi:hypothetical protein
VDWADQNYAWPVLDVWCKHIDGNEEWLRLAESFWKLERIEDLVVIEASDRWAMSMPWKKMICADASGSKTMSMNGRQRFVIQQVLDDGCVMHLIRMPEEVA